MRLGHQLCQLWSVLDVLGYFRARLLQYHGMSLGLHPISIDVARHSS